MILCYTNNKLKRARQYTQVNIYLWYYNNLNNEIIDNLLNSNI